MADKFQDIDVLHDLMGEAGAVAQLLVTKGAFERAFQAFRAEDPKAFRAVLTKAGLAAQCRRICHFIRIKECVFLCLDLAGPPHADPVAPDHRVLAQAVAKLADDPKLAQFAADVLTKRDRAGFAKLVDQLGLAQHAHLFCHWLCMIRYRLVCHWMCHFDRVERPVLWQEIANAAGAVGRLFKDEKAFRLAVAASTAGDAEALRGAIRGAGLLTWCHWICEFFCSWRCVLVCLLINRPFPVKVLDPPVQVREAAVFAQAVAKLADNPGQLAQLSAAVGAGVTEKWAALIKEAHLAPFALQLCHWICSWRCRAFCVLVCPPLAYHPWFTHIGDFSITGDIDTTSGLTNAAKGGHGGPNYGFYSAMSLRGFCPKHDPAHPAEEMAYRFLFQTAGGALTPISGGFVAEVLVGTRYALWNGSLHLQTIRIQGVGATSPTPPTPGPGTEPPDHVIVPDGQGWVRVDQDALDDAFSGYLMGFASQVAVPGGVATSSQPAGQAVPVADQKAGTDCAIVFQATRVSTLADVNNGVAAPDYTNQVDKIRIDNWSEVALLDLLQFHSGGGTPCSGLTTDLDIEYTVDHELIASWSIGMSTASGATLTNPPFGPPPAPPARGNAGTHHENVSGWNPCSYTITLTTRRRLTNGLSDDPDKNTSRTFCIGRR